MPLNSIPLWWPWGGGEPAALPLDDLSGYWHWQAGDVGGSVSPDYSGNGRDGTTHGGAYVSDGTYGTVWEQNGTSSDYIEVPTSALASGTQAMTLLALVKPDSSTGGYTWAAAFGDSEAFFLGIHGDEALGGGFTPDFVESSSNPIVADTWHALAIVYDGSNLRLYVDGVQVATGAASLTHGSATSYIGRQVSFFGEYWLGQIAQVATFDGVALSAAEIAAWTADPFGALTPEFTDIACTISGAESFAAAVEVNADVACTIAGAETFTASVLVLVTVNGPFCVETGRIYAPGIATLAGSKKPAGLIAAPGGSPGEGVNPADGFGVIGRIYVPGAAAGLVQCEMDTTNPDPTDV